MNKIINFKSVNGVWKYKTSIKEKAFEMFVIGLIKWWSEANPDKDWDSNDLTTLKVMKLLFLSSGVNANKDNDGLLDIFNNWLAMPYGHIEEDIMNIIRYKEGEFSFFIISDGRMVLK